MFEVAMSSDRRPDLNREQICEPLGQGSGRLCLLIHWPEIVAE